MSAGRFSRALVLTLLFATHAAALDERAGLSLRPGEPATAEKFILNPTAAATPAPAESVEAEAGEAAKDSAAVRLVAPAPPVSLPERPSLIDKAYLDAYAILSENNSCSGFFGGPRLATVVLNALHPRLQTAVLRNNVAIIMQGQPIYGMDARTGLRYRLFKKAQVNTTGPFFRSASDSNQTFFRSIGRYPANTRKARALMLLHEVGHLVPSGGGSWLLPDDGNDPLRVAANTDAVMDTCGTQLDSLE